MKRIVLAGFLSSLHSTAAPRDRRRTAPRTSENGRYTFNRVDDGYLRLDTRTGQVSICSRRAVGWSCHPMPDERTALENEIARLQDDNARAQERPAGARPAAAGHGQAGGFGSGCQAPGPRTEAAEQCRDRPDDGGVRAHVARLVDMIENWQKETLQRKT